MDMNTKGITGIEATGTWKLPSLVFMMVPCWTEKVCNWAWHVFMRVVLRRIGIILVRIFTSSTCVTVQTFHFLGIMPLGRTAALSKNLAIVKQLNRFVSRRIMEVCFLKYIVKEINLNWLVWGMSSPLKADSYKSSEF